MRKVLEVQASPNGASEIDRLAAASGAIGAVGGYDRNSRPLEEAVAELGAWLSGIIRPWSWEAAADVRPLVLRAVVEGGFARGDVLCGLAALIVSAGREGRLNPWRARESIRVLKELADGGTVSELIELVGQQVAAPK